MHLIGKWSTRPAILLAAAATLVVVRSPRAASSSPYSGSAPSLPGTIAASDFDNGGPGIAFGDTTGGNSGGAYRQTDVDLEASSEGGYDVGWIAAGEWLNYTVNVRTAGKYTATLRVASPSGGGALHLGFNGPSNVWTAITVPATGSWQSWTNVSVPVSLGAGQQQITLVFDKPGFNIRSITVAEPSSGGSSAAAPFGGTPVAVPGTIQAANFDDGGQGVSYSDTTSGNAGGAYRQTDVDVESSSLGGYDVGWIAAGEWLNYTVDVRATATYDVSLRVASPGGGAAVHVGFNGASRFWQSIPIPATGGWQNWTTVRFPATIAAGRQQMTLYADTSGFNIASISIATGGGGSTVPAFSHVYVIAFENKELSSIIGNAAAPYLNTLAAQYALSTNYTAITHPSLPDYMALTGGLTAFADDCTGCTVNAAHIGDAAENASRGWKAYMEDMPGTCGLTDSGAYTARHNPFVHYQDVASNPARCAAHILPLTSLYDDLSAGSVPAFAWITPNLCSDMHDCDVATGDRWVSALVPHIMAAPDFQTSVIFIVWDEGTTNTGGGGVVPLIAVSPHAARGAHSDPANHYDLLRTIVDGLGLTAPGAAASGRPLTELFSQ